MIREGTKVLASITARCHERRARISSRQVRPLGARRTSICRVGSATSALGRTAANITIALFVLVVLTGCALSPIAQSHYSLIDPKGVNLSAYNQDYAECAALANQTDVGGRAAVGAAGGAVAGAIFGALLGAAICGRDCAGYGAGVGAASGVSHGAVGGAVSGANEQQYALRACLTGRGYRVIR